MLWPGLNAPILKSKEVVQRTQLPPNPDREMELIKMRDQMSRIRYTALPPLQRGWSGSRFPGQSIGPPNPIDDCKYPSSYDQLLWWDFIGFCFAHL